MYSLAFSVVLGSLARSADFNAPAEFRVTDHVVAENPGAYTATFGNGPINSWMGAGAFEPIFIRRKFHATGDSPDELLLHRADIEGYNTWKNGLYDGARVRVYRIRNGKLVKAREDTVKAHYASGWRYAGQPGLNGKIVTPDATTAEFRFDSWERRGVPYYLCVRAVDKEGNESADSNVLKLEPPPHPEGEQREPESSLLDPAFPEKPAKRTQPSSPKNLTADVDSAAGIVTLKWDGVDEGGLAGYRVMISDYPPEEHKGFHILLSTNPTEKSKHIRAGDMVFVEKEFRTWSRADRYSNRIYGSYEGRNPLLIPFDSDDTKSWALADHPRPIPDDFTDGGQTCLKLDIRSEERIVLDEYNHSGTSQDYYKTLDPKKRYVVDLWARQEKMASGELTFFLSPPYGEKVKPIHFAVGEEWTHCVGTFTVPEMLETSQVGKMCLGFDGPGTLWLDSFRVYEEGTPFLDFPERDYRALADSGLGALRTHAHIKSPWGYSMEMMTNPMGVTGYSGVQELSPHTLQSFFRIFRKAGVDPWLQIEMCMSEEEWQGFVEYMAAPFDPTVDSRKTKPWAWKRYRQGRRAPWIGEFERVLFEISNETWNPMFRPWFFNWLEMSDEATGRVYNGGEIYGLFQEYVIAQMKTAPCWNEEMEKKFEFVLGGWGISTDENGYGQRAAACSSSSRHMTLAAYNGGWDESEAPPEANDLGFFKALAQVNQVAIPRALLFEETRRKQKATSSADYVLGTYEAGPGYALPNTISAQQVENESRTMKSLAAGTATLDTFLYRGYLGFKLQNFFTFNRGRNYWTSHARYQNGGQAYPSWKALSLYNTQGVGDFLLTHAYTVPTLDLPKTGERIAVTNAPMVAVYATRRNNRYNLFVVSRKLNDYPTRGDDGYSPVTVHLPFKKPAKITLYKMTGDPRANNLDSENVVIDALDVPPKRFKPTFVLDSSTGADERGLPPAATFLYVFEETEPLRKKGLSFLKKERAFAPLVLPGIGQAVSAAYPDRTLRFQVIFPEPVQGFGDQPTDVEISGSALANSAEVVSVPAGYGSAYEVLVSGMRKAGTVEVRIPAGAARKARDGSQCGASKGGNNRITYHVEPEKPNPPTEIGLSVKEGAVYASWNDEFNVARQPDTYTVKILSALGKEIKKAADVIGKRVSIDGIDASKPLYVVIEAVNKAGITASDPALLFNRTFDFSDTAEGQVPGGWFTNNLDGDYSFGVATPTSSPPDIVSPSGTPLFRHVGWGSGMLLYDTNEELKQYDVAMRFARGTCNNYDVNGVVMNHSPGYSIKVTVHSPNRELLLDVNGLSGSSKRGRKITPDPNEAADDPVGPLDFGEFWTLGVRTEPAPSENEVRVLVRLFDDKGQSRLAAEGNVGKMRGEEWDAGLFPTNGKLSGTFGAYGRVNEGGNDGTKGLWIDSIAVSPSLNARKGEEPLRP